MRIPRKPKRPARVEMVPLIDTVFLLLVFFIYAVMSMTIHRGLPLTLPKARSGEPDKEAYLSLSVTEGGDVYLEKRRVTVGELAPLLRERRREEPDLKVYLGADADARHGSVVEVMDRIRGAGVERILMETAGEGEEE